MTRNQTRLSQKKRFQIILLTNKKGVESLEQWAEAAGISPVTLKNYMRGITQPTVNTLCNMADAIGVLPHQLYPQLRRNDGRRQTET